MANIGLLQLMLHNIRGLDRPIFEMIDFAHIYGLRPWIVLYLQYFPNCHLLDQTMTPQPGTSLAAMISNGVRWYYTDAILYRLDKITVI